MPVKIDRRKLTRPLFPLVKYTLESHPSYGGVVTGREPYIITVEHAQHEYANLRGERTYVGERIWLIMSGGRGDKVVAAFYKADSTPDMWATLRALCQWDTDATAFQPLCDQLQEADHWLTPLLRRWWAKASIAPTVRELPPIARKKKLWED